MRKGRACGAVLAMALAIAPGLARAQLDEGVPREEREPAEQAAPPATEEAEPWRIAAALGAPDWLRFGLTHRTRYEHLWSQFRAGAPGDDVGLSLRTTLRGEVRADAVALGVELIDARLHFADADAPLDTTLIDPIDLLQGYVSLEAPDVAFAGATLRVRVGRLTMDLGSRRLVARNEFRNTINAFTGADVGWTSAEEDDLRAFALVPVERRPTSREGLAENAIELDRELASTLLFGVFFVSRALPAELRVEAFVLGLLERDAPELATRDRRLVTPGLRLLRAPARGRLDVELEGALQGGASRATALPEDVADLEHFAFFAHAAIGYSLDLPWLARAQLQWDYASGDPDPSDGANERFDALFGARRFELGPTGIWGAIPRSNVHSPCARIEVRPHPMFEVFAAYRPVWVAQARDAWTASGVRDETGASGDFVGHHVEARARLRVPGNLGVDIGFAHLVRGALAISAPNANPGGDPTYFYAQTWVEM